MKVNPDLGATDAVFSSMKKITDNSCESRVAEGKLTRNLGATQLSFYQRCFEWSPRLLQAHNPTLGGYSSSNFTYKISPRLLWTDNPVLGGYSGWNFKFQRLVPGCCGQLT